jgi:hypothetical protein
MTWNQNCLKGNKQRLMRSEVFKAVRIMMFSLWILALCRLTRLKMETVCFSETLASTGESKRRQNPAEHHHQTTYKQ